MPRSNKIITKEDIQTQQQIIANACQYFQMTEYALLHYANNLIRNTVMYAIYKETNLTHDVISTQVFSRTNPQGSFRASFAIPGALRRKDADAGVISGFYEKYGYCRHLLEANKKAA